jgi:hypothetical protein
MSLVRKMSFSRRRRRSVREKEHSKESVVHTPTEPKDSDDESLCNDDDERLVPLVGALQKQHSSRRASLNGFVHDSARRFYETDDTFHVLYCFRTAIDQVCSCLGDAAAAAGSTPQQLSA